MQHQHQQQRAFKKKAIQEMAAKLPARNRVKGLFTRDMTAEVLKLSHSWRLEGHVNYSIYCGFASKLSDCLNVMRCLCHICFDSSADLHPKQDPVRAIALNLGGIPVNAPALPNFKIVAS